MPESILVVEYEPRYTDRVRQALAGQPLTPTFAKDGEEALRAISETAPKLVVLASVVPKVSAAEIIRTLRSDRRTSSTPILLTVSGYTGSAPRVDAERLGATDILPKPYAEADFLAKVQQMLALEPTAWAPPMDPAFVVRPSEARPAPGGRLTSNDIFGDLLEDAPAPAKEEKKPAVKSGSDVDRMLAETLAGVMPQKKKDAAAPPKPAAGAPQRPKTASGNLDLDKLMEDTLSGLEKRKPAAKPATPPAPAPAPVAAPPPQAAPPSDPGEGTMLSKQVVVVPPPPPPPATTAEDDEPVDGVRFGQYVLLDRIASGGMAEVWRARMRGVEGFQKTVAIKKILPHLSDNQEFIEMFIDEAKLAAQLSHTNIVHIFDLGKIQNSYFIAMEYVEGFDLKTILKRSETHDHPIQVEIALFIASKVAAALDYAHRKRDFENRDLGLVHRDVSPQNVLISEEGDIKLCDFGIAKAASKASHTQAGALKGKLQYMSPEQAWGQLIDRRSDIFSLGTVLFEMLTRRKLFSGDSELSVLDQVREARVTAPSLFNDDVTPQIDAIVLKALSRDPDRRYQTAAEMARDLDQILYSYKPTPTSADLAIFMHRISAPPQDLGSFDNLPDQVTESMPTVKQTPPGEIPVAIPLPPRAAVEPPPVPAPLPVAPAAAPATTPAPGPFAAPEAAPRSKSPVIAIAAVVLIAAVGGGAWMMSRNKTSAAPSSAPTTTSAAMTPRSDAAVPAAVPAAATDAATTTTAAGTMPIIDPAQVDQEVRRRLEAERLRLARQSQPAPVPGTPAVAAARPQPASDDLRPAPAVAPQTPAPAPAPTPAPAVAESRPQPVEVPESRAPETPRVREGDLVATGTEGLVPARMTRQTPPNYPPLARAQRVEGSVVVNVLVSETGQVLETRILSGVNRPVGINEAAVQTVRRSTFAPGTKDGVRVKSWTTVRVDFKL